MFGSSAHLFNDLNLKLIICNVAAKSSVLTGNLKIKSNFKIIIKSFSTTPLFITSKLNPRFSTLKRLLLALYTYVGANCFDGSNNGCSHYCTGAGVCSCPPCWKLDDESGKRCSIESGKATVTCSSTGVTISIDKCAVPGVDASAIHLNDDSCIAISEEENRWTIKSSTIDGCGASAVFENNIFEYANTLHIGRSVVNNIIFTKGAAINFVCKYNGQVTAVSDFKSSYEVSSVTFDAGDVNNEVIDFPLAFNFYEKPDYETPMDFSTKQAAVGNTLFAKTSVL